MSILPVTYTPAEVRDLRAAVQDWLNTTAQTLDPILIELTVMTHMMAGHRAADI